MLQVEKVGEIGRGKRSAEEHHAVALERECARDDPTAERVGIVLGARDDHGRTTGALGSRPEPDQQVIDGGAGCVLVGDAEIARRPPSAQLCLHRAEHVDHDVVEGHAVREKFDRDPIREWDVAIDEGGQHRKTLVVFRPIVGLDTHRVRLQSSSQSSLGCVGGDRSQPTASLTATDIFPTLRTAHIPRPHRRHVRGRSRSGLRRCP